MRIGPARRATTYQRQEDELLLARMAALAIGSPRAAGWPAQPPRPERTRRRSSGGSAREPRSAAGHLSTQAPSMQAAAAVVDARRDDHVSARERLDDEMPSVETSRTSRRGSSSVGSGAL